MPADAALFTVGSHDHGERIPAHEALDASLDFAAAGIDRLLLDRNGIDVRRVGREGKFDSRLLRVAVKLSEERLHALRAAALKHIVERIKPFPRFDLVEPVAHAPGAV